MIRRTIDVLQVAPLGYFVFEALNDDVVSVGTVNPYKVHFLISLIVAYFIKSDDAHE